MTSERHVLRVPDGDLDELRSRLRHPAGLWPWPGQGTRGDWQAGTAEGELRGLPGTGPTVRLSVSPAW